MPHVVADRVLETSTSSGTGVFALAGAVLGFRAFSAVCAVADTVPYFIEAVDNQGRTTGEWEFGLGTYSAANQLTRTTVRGSSNGGLAVSFAAGTKLVGLGVPAPNSSATRAEWRAALGFTALGNSLVTAADAAAARAALLLPIYQPRIDVASAATVNLTASAPNTDHINITGTTAITGFTVAAGRLIFARFNASLTLTNGAGLVTQTGANIVTQAGDTCLLRATAANTVEVLSYTPVSLNQQSVRSTVKLFGSAATPSVNNAIRRFSTVHTNVGSDITYADSASLGMSCTINTPGVYAITYVDSASGSGMNLGISKNSNQLTTAISSITATDALAWTQAIAGTPNSVSVTVPLAAGDVIRAHASNTANSPFCQFVITRVQ